MILFLSPHLRTVSRLFLLALMITGITITAASATDPRILALTKNMDCTVYRLSETRQRVPLTSENTIPGAPSAWALLNEGPAPATIYAGNGAKIPLPVFTGKIELFTGDARLRYSVGLRSTGSAVIRVCR